MDIDTIGKDDRVIRYNYDSLEDLISYSDGGAEK